MGAFFWVILGRDSLPLQKLLWGRMFQAIT